MRGKISSVISIVCITSILAGCGSEFPELTDEQYQQTVEYAAGLLMKYSNNGIEKLAYVTKDDVEEYLTEINGETEEEDSDEVKPTTTTKTETTVETTEKEKETDSATAKSSSDTSVSNISDSSSTKDSLGNVEDIDLSSATTEASSSSEASTEEKAASHSATTEISIESVENITDSDDSSEESSSETSLSEGTVLSETDKQSLGNGLYLTYTGYYVTTSYPQDDDSFVITADTGKKLLVLGFRVMNETSSAVTLDMVSTNPHFQILVNGENIGYTGVTILENDLSSFYGTIAAGEKKSLVLVKQISEADSKNIDSLGMIASINGTEQTVTLE